jgi:hypothetical protein
MRYRIVLIFSLMAAALAVISATFAVSASPQPQGAQFATPTPQPDGRIIYIVPAGFTCTQISLLTGVSVDQLRALNNLDADCTLVEGQQLLLGLGGPAAATPTEGPSPTPTTVLPTPTPFFGTGEICILLYDDKNGDTIRQPDTEPAIPGGAVSVTGANVAYSATKDTSEGLLDPDYQGVCFLEVPEGDFNISVAVPDGFNPTMLLSTEISLRAGQRIFVGFGAQSQTVTVETDPEGGSPVMGIVGVSLLLAGAGLAFYARQLRKAPRGMSLR